MNWGWNGDYREERYLADSPWRADEYDFKTKETMIIGFTRKN